MLLQPQYGPEPLLTLDGDPAAIAGPSIRQRDRLLGVLATLTDEQWETPSRCEGWSVRDCMVHLESTHGFWEMSIRGGLAGTPTEFLASFDPAASPAAMVAASTLSPSDLLDKMRTSAHSLNELLSSLEFKDWDAFAEAPPGHISVSAVAHHALWDSWIHERDVLLPLGLEVDEEPDEIEACVRYATALAVSFAVVFDETTDVAFSVDVVNPKISFDLTATNTVSVTSGATFDDVATGEAIELLEAVSRRGPYGSGTSATIRDAVSGLGRAFDQITD